MEDVCKNRGGRQWVKLFFFFFFFITIAIDVGINECGFIVNLAIAGP